MAVGEQGDIVSFDAGAATEAVLEVVDGPLYSLVEFDHEQWNTIYVAPETEAMYESETEREEHFDRIHDYVNLDFAEMELFTENLLPIADDVRYITTAMDVMTFVRIYFHGRKGVFVALDPDEAVEPVVGAIEAAME